MHPEFPSCPCSTQQSYVGVNFASTFYESQSAANMIVGSVYLGKKARKAYRKRQAEKVAKQLVGGIEVADPSEELTLKAPPGSPTGRFTSPTSTYSTIPPSSGSGESHRSDSKSALTPSSTYSSYVPPLTPAEQADVFAQYDRRDLSNLYPEQPPSYDMALNSSRAEGTASLGRISHASVGHLHNDNVQDSVMDDCPTCLALFRQRHLHSHHHLKLHSAERPVDAYGSRPLEICSEADVPGQTRMVAELPAKPLGRPRAELSDTSASVELPAELPCETPQRRDTGPFQETAVENGREKTGSRPVELPADIDIARRSVPSESAL